MCKSSLSIKVISSNRIILLSSLVGVAEVESKSYHGKPSKYENIF